MSSVWNVDAGYIKESNDIKYDDLVITNDIKNFIDIDHDNSFFLVAPKGFGRTVFLMYKRILYQNKYKNENYLLIPRGELVDSPHSIRIFDKKKDGLLKNIENWTNIWLATIILSIIKNLKNSNGNHKNEAVNELLDDFQKFKLTQASKFIDDVYNTPIDFLSGIINMSYSEFYKFMDKELNDLTTIISGKNIPTAIFIDNIDELFEEHLEYYNEIESSRGILIPGIWYNSQIGLIYAVRVLSNLNGHIKVFASIRKEAIMKLSKDDLRELQTSGNMLDIKYSKSDIKEIFIKNIKKMNPKDLSKPEYLDKDPIFSFLGINKVTNRHTNEEEDIFNYIYRHTLKKPRDIILMGMELYKNNPKKDVETMKIVNQVANVIAEDYFNVIRRHIDIDRNKISEFFKLIDSNILSEKRIKIICKKFNNKQDCRNMDCKKCEKTHVFCNLYKTGLLGIIKLDGVTNTYVQYFLQPGEETFAESGILPPSPYYLIHPILNKLMRDVNSNYKINNQIIVGDDYPWEQLKRRCYFRNNQQCTYPESLQGIFLISSNKYLSFIKELNDKLESMDYEVDSRFKSEASTGLIFCDKVCKKIRNNSSMIADISDMNPDVFFEVGFALGLGKSVFLIKDKSIGKIINFNLLYDKYNNSDDIIKVLRDTFSNEKKRHLGNIDQFEYPEKRKKNGNVYVLSFNQNNEFIEKLKNFGYIQPNHLDQIFTNPDLIREVIDAKTVLVHLEGRQNEINGNQINDAKLMFLSGICAAQNIPVQIFQFNANFYSDVSEISLFPSSVDELTIYVNGLCLDGQLSPDDLENKARLLIAKQDYSKGKPILEQVIKLDPERKQLIYNEFGFLYDFISSVDKNETRWIRNKELLNWRKNLWYIISERNNFFLETNEKQPGIQTKEKQEVEIEIDSLNEGNLKIIDAPKLHSQEKGEVLEKAVLELFRQFFVIAEEFENAIVKKLRQQKKGLQFGHDISFECFVKEFNNVQCHIECKNYEKNEITLKDIADKLASTEAYCPCIDHWILISPHCSPSNELNNLLNIWNDKNRYPFEIQIWCPDTGVNELFGLSPPIYDLFYQSEKNEMHPLNWSNEKRLKIFDKWKQKLKPLTRLPKEWERYLHEPSWLLLKEERDRIREMEALYQNYVPLRCMDKTRKIMELSLENHVLEWLGDSTKNFIFLLGEFGDGKTAFTYILSRNLAKGFINNPSKGWIPVRFSLRDYQFIKNGQDFLRRRLEEFGANLASWNSLRTQNRFLIILDGFDEMSKRLDPVIISKNIKDLLDCCNEFEGSKIIVTSRTHFFENQRDEERLFQRLGYPLMLYLAPIDRQTNIKHLEEYAKKPDIKKKLRSIYKLHDPIGLASKPLFLQMIKETLDELPENNFDEVTLYETYIQKSLKRKSDQLDDRELISLPKETIDNLITILEDIAIYLQLSDKNFVFLSDFQDRDKRNFAQLLWKISGSDTEIINETDNMESTTVEDATARVGIRSLLARVETEEHNKKWPVDFCHRSMREFFIAKGICRALTEDLDGAREILTKLPLNHEVLYFASELMRKNDTMQYEVNLLELIKSTKYCINKESLGGNAVTLLFSLKRELPGDDWSRLNLDYAYLSGADLSNKSFYATSLIYANLDNVNFEGADFRECDLTGVRIEETKPVQAITVHPAKDRIIVAYGDNTIREWNIMQQWKQSSRIIHQNKNGFINWLGAIEGNDLCAITNEELIFYDFKEQGELSQISRFRIKPTFRQLLPKSNILLLLSKEKNLMCKSTLIDLKYPRILQSIELENIAHCESLDVNAFILSERGSLYIKGIESSDIEFTPSLPSSELTSLCVICYKKDSQYFLGCGQRNGEVLVWQIDLFENKWKYKLLLRNRVHDGLVSALAFLDDLRIISGGIDRKISIIRFDPDSSDIQGIQERILHLTIRCKGMRIEGVKGEREREMLKELILKA